MHYKTIRQIKSGLGLCFYKDGEGEGGASGGSAGGAGANKDGANAPDHAAEIAALKAEIESLKSSKPKPEDDDLKEKARKEREASNKDSDRTKKLENALKFNLKSDEFLKQNESLLPKEVRDIFSQAEKEKYSDAIEKDAAIKSGMIQSFFSVQSNVDLLTAGQKSALDDYLTLTKNGKQEKAQSVYDMVFEPAFERLRAVKKAEALQKGHGAGDDDSYKKRIEAGSKKHYFGEK